MSAQRPWVMRGLLVWLGAVLIVAALEGGHMTDAWREAAAAGGSDDDAADDSSRFWFDNSSSGDDSGDRSDTESGSGGGQDDAGAEGSSSGNGSDQDATTNAAGDNETEPANGSSEDGLASDQASAPAGGSQDDGGQEADTVSDDQESFSEGGSGGARSTSKSDITSLDVGGLDPIWLPEPRIVAMSVVVLLSLGMLGSMLIGVAASEASRLGLLLAVVGPLVALAVKGEHGTFTRGRVMGYVESHPGIHFSALRDALGLANGVTAHHLYQLERQGAIISWVDGRRRRFAAAGVDPIRLKEIRNPATGMQLAILEVLADAGDLGLSGTELREQLSSSRQLLSYHLQSLRERDLVEPEGGGRKRRWTLSELGERRLEASQGLES